MADVPGLDMSLEDAMTTQRSVRRIRPDPVDDALVLRLIELAQKAPTQQNSQAWEFIVVKDPAVKAKLARQNRRMWRLYRPIAAWKARNDPKTQRMNAAVSWSVEHFEETPVFVVACIRGSRVAFPPIVAASTYGSIFPSIQNLLLGARAVGLGANLVTMPLWSNRAARRILGLPWSVTPVAMVPLGWPIGRYGPTTRRPVGDAVSLDRFGNRPWRGHPARSPRTPRLAFVDAADVPWTEVIAQQHGERRVSVHEKFLEWNARRMVVLGRYDPHVVIERHGHASDHLVYVVEGELTIGERRSGPGTLVVLEVGATFGPLVAGPEGALLFETWAGDPRPVPADKAEYHALLAARGIVRLPNPPFTKPATAPRQADDGKDLYS